MTQNSSQDQHIAGSKDETQNKAGDTDLSQVYNKSVKGTSNNILLLGYLRGGTTFASGILQRIPSAFYAFEPLRYQLQKPLGTEDYFSARGICSFISGHCRYRDPGDSNSQTSSVTKRVVRLFQLFYSCKIKKLPPKFSWRRHMDTDQLLRSCATPNTTQCQTLMKMCLNSSAKIIKTVRLAFDIVEALIMNIPDLKVIFLLRDPRGLLHSRHRTNFIDRSNTQLLVSHLKSDCRRILNDIRHYLQVQENFPKKVTAILYENLATNPESESQKLFDFLQTKPDKDYNIWLENVTRRGHFDNTFGVARPLSKESALRWRREMSFALAKTVDKTIECVQVYNLMGLTTLGTEVKMRNVGVSLMSKTHGIFSNSTHSEKRRKSLIY